MGLQEIVSWYQKKIGTYDKQQWEKTVEQRILHGLKHVMKRTAKLKSDLIDVDLVRGSSFPKAKPKHGFLTVTRLALIRCLLLPVYYKWWIKQTCLSVYCFLLILHVFQCFNLGIYFYYSGQHPDLFEHISAYEILVPAGMMIVLSVIHSEIVATSDVVHQQSSHSSKIASHRVTARRTRRPRAKVKSRHPSFDSNADIPDALNSTLRSQSDKGVRRHIVVWGTPQREIIPTASAAPAEDDGFESLNSNGSSEDMPSCGAKSQVSDIDTKPTFDGSATENGAFWAPKQSNCRRRSGQTCTPNCETCDPETDHKDSDSETDAPNFGELRSSSSSERQQLLQCRRGSTSSKINKFVQSASSESDIERDGPNLTEATTSAVEWLGITTNSEECSVNSEVDEDDHRTVEDHPFAWEFQMSPTTVLSPSCAASDRVSCTIWEKHDIQRADLSVLDISSAIIARVELMPENMDYFYAGLCVSLLIALLPSLCRLFEVSDEVTAPEIISPSLNIVSVESAFQRLSILAPQLIDTIFGETLLQRIVVVIAFIERFFLSAVFFFLIAVAERTFKQRFLYAKLFSHLTSFRRARKSELPHFRLNKVRNIKTWLSIRSYLKRRGPQRSVDVIVSAAFIITLLLLSFLSVELLKDSVRLHSEYNLEALLWCLVLGVFLLRFMTLGNKTNRKYRNLSVLITEQINLYLQIEQKPNKKEELMVANSVLKLAADLLKELESPFKISGLSANPYVYTITKVVILSALSGVLSEMLGFKLKLHKIKIK